MSRAFFGRPTVRVAQELLGKKLVYQGQSGLITETEAYTAIDDPACHAYRGRTPRNAPMFGAPGFSYVYFIYGLHFCLNIVTEADGVAAAVLLRGLLHDDGRHDAGPGKLCRSLGITTAQTGLDMTATDDFYVQDAPHCPDFITTPRIGLSKGADLPWRFVVSKAGLGRLREKF